MHEESNLEAPSPTDFFQHEEVPKPVRDLVKNGIDLFVDTNERVVYVHPDAMKCASKGGSLFVAGPHRTHFDGAALSREIPNLLMIAAADYWSPDNIIKAAIQHSERLLLVKRDEGDVSKITQVRTPAFEDIVEFLAQGWNVGVFPEGSRDESHRWQFKGGLAFLTILYKKMHEKMPPIIPVGLAGFEHIFPKGSKFPSIGRSAGIVVGAPLDEEEINLILGQSETAKSKRAQLTSFFLKKVRTTHEIAQEMLSRHKEKIRTVPRFGRTIIDVASGQIYPPQSSEKE